MSVILVCKSDEIKNNMSHIARNFALRNRMSERFRKSGRSKKQKKQNFHRLRQDFAAEKFCRNSLGKTLFPKNPRTPQKEKAANASKCNLSYAFYKSSTS